MAQTKINIEVNAAATPVDLCGPGATQMDKRRSEPLPPTHITPQYRFDIGRLSPLFPQKLRDLPEICFNVADYLMTSSFDVSYYNLADNCGTQALVTLGVPKERLEVFTKIVKLHFYSDLLGFHPMPQRQSAWTIESLSVAIKFFKISAGIIVREKDENYLLFPNGKADCFILLDNYHYSVIRLDLRHLFYCKQMCDYHYLWYGYGKKDRQDRKFQIVSSKVPLKKDNRTIWRPELLPSYGYTSDDLKEQLTRDYNQKKYKKFPKKFSSTAFSNFLPKEKKIFTFDGAHDYIQFIMDLLISFSTIKRMAFSDVAKAIYLFIRTRGIEMRDFYNTCKDFLFFKFFRLHIFSRFFDVEDDIPFQDFDTTKILETVKEQEAIKDIYDMLMHLGKINMTFQDYKDQYSGGKDFSFMTEYMEASKGVPFLARKTSQSLLSESEGEEETKQSPSLFYPHKFSSTEDGPDISFLTKTKNTLLWPFISQLIISLLAMAFATAASCAVSRDKLALINTCVLQSCNKLDVYGLLQWAMEFLQDKFPFVAKQLPGYQYALDKAYARSQFYKIKCSMSVNNIALNFKDYFQSGESYYDAIVELIEKYQAYFCQKELIELNKLKAAAFSALQNGKPRVPPFSVGLIGGSAQGKTTCINRLRAIFASVYNIPSDIDKEKWKDKEYMSKITDEYRMFNLNVADSYVSGYTDQEMIVFDDAGATKPEFSPNSELSFILQAINGINTPTLQAGVENKGNVYFKNTSFVITSNSKFFGAAQTMTCPQAVLRRFNLVAEIRIDRTKQSMEKVVDCYTVTPYKVNIIRHEDFSQEKWEYDPILGYDSDGIPRTCNWSSFEAMVYDECLDFKRRQEIIMNAQKYVLFCRDCKSTFCTCSEKAKVRLTKASPININTASATPLLAYDSDDDQSKLDVSGEDQVYLPLCEKNPVKKEVTFGSKQYYPLVDKFSSTSGCEFLSGFAMCMIGVLFYHYSNKIIKRVNETAQVVYETAERLDSAVGQVNTYCSAFLNFTQSAEKKIQNLRRYWMTRYENLKLALQLSPRVKQFLLLLLGGVIGVLAGGLLYKWVITNELNAQKVQSFSKVQVPQTEFVSNATFESIPSRTTTSEIKQKKIFNNIWRVEVFSLDGLTRSTVSMLAIGDRYALMVNHFAKKLTRGQQIIMTKNVPGQVGVVLRTTSSSFKIVEQFVDSDMALVFVESMPLSADIQPYILHEIPESLELWRAPKEGEVFAASPFLFHRKELSLIHTDQADPNCIIFRSTLSIEKGHCGSIVVCSKTQNIVGLVVGSADEDKTFGLFVPIPRFVMKPRIVDVPIPIQVGGKSTQLKEANVDKLKFSSVHSVLEVIAATDSYPRPSCTKVRRTVLDDSIESVLDPMGVPFGIRHKPTPELDPVELRGHRPQMGKAIKRALDVLHDVGEPFDTEELRQCRVQYTVRVAKTLKNFNPSDLKLPSRILTFEEGVLGKFEGKDIPGVNPMVINTSAGFPLGGLKSDYIERRDGIVQFEPNFHDELCRKLEQLNRGERIQSFSIACLKDEVVKQSKTKSRLFYIVDLYNTLLARCVFAPLLSFCSQFPFLSECAQGINNHSTQWENLYDYLAEVGEDYCFDGDYTDYDLTMPRDVIQQSFEFVFWFLEWCGFSEQHLLAAKTLAQELIEPNVFLGPYLYRWYRGWISGNVLTFIVNSISNSIIDRATYRSLTQRTDFDIQVRTIKGGDDVITSYSGVDTRYNMNAIMRFLKDKGFIYTSAMKDGKCLEYKRLDECQFFKRNFVREGDKMLSPIDPNSMVKMLTWTDSDNLHEQTLGSVESALREAFHHGREYFTGFSQQLEQVCARTSILRGVEGNYAQYINAFGYFDYYRYDNQFKRLPPILRDYPFLVDNEEASYSDSPEQSGYDRAISS